MFRRLTASGFFFENRESLSERAQRALHLAEASEGRCRAQPVAVVEGGYAGEDFARGHVVARRALGREHNVVANLQVPGDADLPGEYDAASDVRTSGEADLRAQ